jgi:DNA mismatch repair ATPase MutS
VLSRIVDLETCILRELSVLVAEAMPALLAIRAALASFDAHFALARAGINMTTPVVNTQGDLFI